VPRKLLSGTLPHCCSHYSNNNRARDCETDSMAYDAIPQHTTENQPPRKRLPFVDGSRGLASLWIVCQHFLPHSSNGPLVKSLWRSNCAVDYFIVLSGFVTHWAARGKFSQSANRWPDAKRWYGRRFGRVLLAVWLAMGVSAVLLYLGGNGDLDATHLTLCAFLVEPWRSVWKSNVGRPTPSTRCLTA
jgi:peptidoglycan/LPS O-acetylase OafA/YrhL